MWNPFQPSKRALHRISQRTESHCGPATLQMLLSRVGVFVDQDTIVESIGVKERIAEHGVNLAQLSHAIEYLAPYHQFWYKKDATIDDLVALVQYYDVPVGVEWQGLFYASIEDELKANSPNDHGHYAVVTKIDPSKDEIVITDPYPEFIHNDRYFSLQWFESRWWDTNQIDDPTTGRQLIIEDYHCLFIVCDKDESFPRVLGMQR
jgi:hypothetical protein